MATTTKINLQIRNGTAAALPGTLVVGQLYAATDNGKLYIGTGAGATLQLGPTLTGDVTTAGGGAFVTTIAAAAVTYAKMQNVSAVSKLLGRGSASTGSPQEITLGNGLAMSTTTLSVSQTLGATTSVMTGIGVANIQTSAAGVGNGADTTDDTLFTYSLPLNSMSAAGKSVRVRAWGTSAANVNVKDIKLWFAGITLADSGAIALNNSDWCIEFEATCIDATHVSTVGTWSDNGLAAAAVVCKKNQAVADLTANASVIKVTGASTIAGTASDVLGYGLKVWFEN